MKTLPKNWTQAGDRFYNESAEMQIGFEADFANRELFKTYALVGDGRGKFYISKRAQSLRNAQADAISYMRKHQNG